MIWASLGVSPAAAQSREWWVDYSHERAATSTDGIDSVWTTDRFATMWSRAGRGHWLFTVEHQQRSGLSDVAVQGLGYWRAGDWTFSADGGATPRADFLYRAKGGGEISRRVAGTLVASGAYHFLQFPSADIHQFEPALTWYYPRGTIEGRVYVTRNATQARTSTTTLLRAACDVAPRLRLSGGASVGDRTFDVASLPSGSATARVVFGEAQVGVTRHDFITAAVTGAHENPGFSYAALRLAYRRLF